MSHSIKFNHSPTNEIELNQGKTSYSNLFAIAAMSVSSETIYPGNDSFYTKYQTDKNGLEAIASQASDLLTSLHNATSVIGVLLANVDIGDVKDEISSVAWLITGLSELAETVSASHDDMQQTLAVYDEIQNMNNLKSIAS